MKTSEKQFYLCSIVNWSVNSFKLIGQKGSFLKLFFVALSSLRIACCCRSGSSLSPCGYFSVLGWSAILWLVAERGGGTFRFCVEWPMCSYCCYTRDTLGSVKGRCFTGPCNLYVKLSPASLRQDVCDVVPLYRRQILVLCVYWFVQRGKRPFKLW